MPKVPQDAPLKRARLVLVALALATVSGFRSVHTLQPMQKVFDVVFRDDMLGYLSSHAFSAGLASGTAGCAFIVWALRMRFAIGATFMALSIVGMVAAVCSAIYGYLRSNESQVYAYLLASGVGAVILAVPVAVLLRVAAPLRVIALAVALPAIWVVGVSFVLSNRHNVTEITTYSVFYIRWQALFLGVFAAAQRKDG